MENETKEQLIERLADEFVVKTEFRLNFAGRSFLRHQLREAYDAGQTFGYGITNSIPSTSFGSLAGGRRKGP